MTETIKAKSRPLEEILSKTYQIPPFQRDYAWKKEQIIDLLLDCENAFTNKVTEYFFGSMVFVNDASEDRLIIVDGQQRLATFLILISLLIDLHKKNPSPIKSIKDKINFYKKFLCIGKTPRLLLNDFNNPFFNNTVLKNELPEDKLKKKQKNANQIIFNSYKILYDYQKKYPKRFSIDKLVKIINNTLKKFQIMAVYVSNIETAYRAFATINQRGLGLTLGDLIKNEILFRDKNNVSDHLTSWDTMLVNLGRKNVDDFLKHSWYVHYGYVQEQNLYATMVKKMKIIKNVKTIMGHFEHDSKAYGEFQDPDNSRWTDSNLIQSLHEMNMLKMDNSRPLLLASLNLSEKNFAKIVRKCVDLHVRAKTFGPKSPEEMVKTMASIAYYFNKIQSKNLPALFKKMGSLDVTDQFFIRSIVETEFSNSDAKYFLSKIEKEKSGRYTIKQLTSDASVEHIAPETRSNNWKHISAERYYEIIYSIGNLTLLHKSPNSSIGNKSFKDKKQVYKKTSNDLIITKEIANVKSDVWDETNITSRTKRLANLAPQIWEKI